MTATKYLNYVNGAFVPERSGAAFLDVESPADASVIGQVVMSTSQDLDEAVQIAKGAQLKWGALTAKSRALVLHKLYELIRDNANEFAECIMKEHGKNRPEALAEVAKGNETVEYACSYPIVGRGNVLEVSRGVHCEDVREPIGVVAHIVPFNFPAMVPLWTIPIALAAGNSVILKPSEKVPITMNLMARLFKEAGIPDGVFNIINGGKEAVEAICNHEDIAAVTFVGSSKIAQIVADTCHSKNKRVLAMGGAKNHLVALPDCEIDATATDIVGSFTGCCGQRCMAASVLVVVDDDKEFSKRLLDTVADKSRGLVAGQEKGEMGPLIDSAAVERVTRYIADAESRGAQILLDGRKWEHPEKGHWVGPTIIVHPQGTTPEDPCIKDEIFGPVISVVHAASRTEAIEFENASGYGNAACIYTSSGANAEWFSKRFTAAMIGVNIGVPVPREPFSFGGMGLSKFGAHGDVTGDSAVEFFSRRRKITSRWPVAGNSDNLPWFK